jgi:hypothetical protein
LREPEASEAKYSFCAQKLLRDMLIINIDGTKIGPSQNKSGIKIIEMK